VLIVFLCKKSIKVRLKQEMIDIELPIAYVMQANGMLGLLDKYRDNQTITLREIQKEWSEMYKVDSTQHPFLNQYLKI
jgi:hypothetical protein